MTMLAISIIGAAFPHHTTYRRGGLTLSREPLDVDDAALSVDALIDLATDPHIRMVVVGDVSVELVAVLAASRELVAAHVPRQGEMPDRTPLIAALEAAKTKLRAAHAKGTA
jgi:hypothetical protein